jgi:peptide chain release factor 3
MRSCCSNAASTTASPSRSRCSGLDDPQLPPLLPRAALAKWRDEVEMAKGLCPPFDPQANREGHLTPVYFGRALNNFGVRELLAGVGELAPVPRPQPADPRPISLEEPDVAGFVFNLQAIIDTRSTATASRLCGSPRAAGRLMSVRALVFFLAPRAQPRRGSLAWRNHRPSPTMGASGSATP